MSFDHADRLIDARDAARRRGRSYTEQVSFAVERDGREVEVDITVEISGADATTGTPASAAITDVRLAGAPWTGTLTERERDYVLSSF